MEGEREVFKHILFSLKVVVTHSVEECLFIAQNIVVFEVVLHLFFKNLACFYNFLIFEVFQPRQHSLICVLLTGKMHFEVSFKIILIIKSHNRLCFVLVFFYLVRWIVRLSQTGLLFEEGKLLQLSPNKVGFL